MVHKTYSQDVEVKVSAKRLWSALVLDSQNFIPKSEPDKVAGVEFEGKAEEIGSVRVIKFHKGMSA